VLFHISVTTTASATASCPAVEGVNAAAREIVDDPLGKDLGCGGWRE
jgi:hypothetical protein